MPNTSFKQWVSENATLVGFLGAQTVGILAAVLSMTVYMTRLEGRVATLEVRGSPHLERIENRLTGLESMTKSNQERLDRIVSIMTKDVGK